MKEYPMKHFVTRALPFAVGLLLAACGAYLLAQERAQTTDQAPKQTKGTRTPVVNMREMPVDVDLEIMEDFRTSLGVECAFCHVSGSRLEKGHAGDRQSDDAPHKVIARDMIRMTKEINQALTGNGVFPDAANVVTCWTCHRGNRMPPTLPPSSGANVQGR
jgi:Photosynthetic reaction centre cytochrome C subunit